MDSEPVGNATEPVTDEPMPSILVQVDHRTHTALIATEGDVRSDDVAIAICSLMRSLQIFGVSSSLRVQVAISDAITTATMETILALSHDVPEIAVEVRRQMEWLDDIRKKHMMKEDNVRPN